ncbi:hypothetical protein [Streptomyces sp. JJ38]|uniref:hypothetical protein n=1 Tax=Streptomyces sp. JJ38 TaxID=2738128 RepID=UPI001C56BA42|nr:hypothetical protein [Streptomyces sp. JJ38]MBW1595753.1 hypothetical protein [Streptomyces sp. JJ38]
MRIKLSNLVGILAAAAFSLGVAITGPNVADTAPGVAISEQGGGTLGTFDDKGTP